MKILHTFNYNYFITLTRKLGMKVIKPRKQVQNRTV